MNRYSIAIVFGLVMASVSHAECRVVTWEEPRPFLANQGEKIILDDGGLEIWEVNSYDYKYAYEYPYSAKLCELKDGSTVAFVEDLAVEVRRIR